MKTRLNIACRAGMIGAAMLLMALAMPNALRAQDTYEVHYSSGGGGNADEGTLNFTVNLDNGTSEEVSITADGTSNFALPAGVDVSSVTFENQVLAVGFDDASGTYSIPWRGGCLRWCIKCRWVRWSWWIRCRIIVYWDPCC